MGETENTVPTIQTFLVADSVVRTPALCCSCLSFYLVHSSPTRTQSARRGSLPSSNKNQEPCEIEGSNCFRGIFGASEISSRQGTGQDLISHF